MDPCPDATRDDGHRLWNVAGRPPPSFGAVFCKYGGALTVFYGLLGLFSALSGMKFEFTADRVDGGIPLPSSWPAIAILGAGGVGLYWLGTRWDRPRFAAVRSRHPWLVPVVIVFVAFPALVAVIFALVS